MRIIVVLVAVLLMFSGCGPAPGVFPGSLNVILLAESPQEIEVRSDSGGKENFSVRATLVGANLSYRAGSPTPKVAVVKIKNRGNKAIYSLMVPEDFDEDSAFATAFAELQRQFPFISIPPEVHTLLISVRSYDFEVPDAEEIMRFVEAFRNDICGGNADTCRYMRVIEPGENVPAISDYFADWPFLEF